MNIVSRNSQSRQHIPVRTRWGNWKHDSSAKTLDFVPPDGRPGAGWFISTKLMRTPHDVRTVLDNSMRKTWITKDDAIDFAMAIQDLGLGREREIRQV